MFRSLLHKIYKGMIQPYGISNSQGSSLNKNISTVSTQSSLSDSRLPDIYDKSYKSVVEINTTFPEKGLNTGTGFVYDKYILTNAHVVSNEGKTGIINVSFWDGSSYEAKVLGHDILVDLAVLSLPE